jgi:hypothetical protein
LFNRLKRRVAKPHLAIRDTLFGDIPLAELVLVPQETLAMEPWASFDCANRAIEAADKRVAIGALRSILEMPNLESRMHLQAWSVLRELGVMPTRGKEKELMGVVVEVGTPKGLDLLAAYADHRARYYNFSGAGVVWERPNSVLDASIDDLLRVGAEVVQAIGPWKKDRPPAPGKGDARINLLTPSGLHFGHGPLKSLAEDGLGGAVIISASMLMKQLTTLPRQ